MQANDVQNLAHTMINYNYCLANPSNNMGYSADCWGLTACDIQSGYNAKFANQRYGYYSAYSGYIIHCLYAPHNRYRLCTFFIINWATKPGARMAFMIHLTPEHPLVRDI